MRNIAANDDPVTIFKLIQYGEHSDTQITVRLSDDIESLKQRVCCCFLRCNGDGQFPVRTVAHFYQQTLQCLPIESEGRAFANIAGQALFYCTVLRCPSENDELVLVSHVRQYTVCVWQADRTTVVYSGCINVEWSCVIELGVLCCVYPDSAAANRTCNEHIPSTQ